MTIGRVVWRGAQAGLGLALAVAGLTWLNRVAASVMAVGGSCGSGGPYEIATPCPQGAWMAPAGIFLALGGLGVYGLRRPPGSPQLLLFAWPALFGSLGVQFLRAATQETNAYGFWLCGAVFLLMAVAPLVFVVTADRRALVHALLGDGGAASDGPERGETPRIAHLGPEGRITRRSAGVPVILLADDEPGELASNLDRLSRLHRSGELSDTEFADAKQKVLDGS